MDVRCERCSTEYEFDDALVSGRGTTVKCTNCGHKFKIRRGDGDYSEDYWNITTADGKTLVFTSLREMQRAIQAYLVERDDRLSRGGLPPKAIGQIPELAPFFEQREAAKRGSSSGRTAKTQDGLGPVAAVAVAGAMSPRPRLATKPEFPAPPADGVPSSGGAVSSKTTLIGTGPVSDVPAFGAAPASQVAAGSVPPPATEREREGSVGEPTSAPAASLAETPVVATLVVATPVVATPVVPTPIVATPVVPAPAPPTNALPMPSSRPREGTNTVPLTRPTPPVPPGQSAGANPPPVPPGQSAGSNLPPVSPGQSVASNPALFFERSPRSLEPGPPASKEASSLSEPPPRFAPTLPVAASPTPPPARRNQRSLLAEVEGDDDRTRPDLPRPKRRPLGGFLASAAAGSLLMLGAVWAQKNLTPTLGDKPPVPVVTSEPVPSTVLTAGDEALADGTSEQRAQPMTKLGVPLAPDAGTAEARLDSAAKAADTGKAEARPDSAAVAADAGKAEARLDSAAVAVDTGDAGRPTGRTKAARDVRELVRQGERARARGDHERARALFTAAIEKNPNDSEALAGLAAIAHAQHDLSGARASYMRVIAINPNYMPAVVGLADVEWESGDKAAASRMYKDIVDRYPEGAYPGRVKQRAEGGG